MFLYNFKINKKKIMKLFIVICSIIIFIILSFGIYYIFFKEHIEEKNEIKIKDTINSEEVFEITPKNYTSILDAVSTDLNSYIGCKIHFTGYVYRLIDFDKNEFVLARDMLVDKDSFQSLVVGFLCTYPNAEDFETGKWVDLTGIITKGDYYGEIAEIKVTSIFECSEPEEKYVSVPDKTYIPTVNMF